MKDILPLLGVSDWGELEDDLCISLRRIIPGVEALKQGWPEAFREKIEALREPVETLEEPPKPKELPSAMSSSPEPTKSQRDTKEALEVSPKSRIPWPLIAIPLFILCLLCIAAVVFVRPIVGNIFSPGTTMPQAAQTSVPLIQETSTPGISPTVQRTETSVSLPTDTLTLTLTFTPTATLTPIPTDTKSPLGLVKGDELQDNRVTLKLTDIQYNQKYDRIGAKVAPISFFFDFTNHSGETIVLQFDSSYFQSVDNTGYEADCWFYHISGAGEKVNEPLNNGDTREIVARCGLGNLNPNVTTVTLTIHPFTSLPESTWIAQIPH